MKMPEPVGTVQSIDALSLVGVAMPVMPPVGTNLYSETQLSEALAQQADELMQLQEQNTALDAKLASNEAVMKQALEALNMAASFKEGGNRMARAAIKALEDALK